VSGTTTPDDQPEAAVETEPEAPVEAAPTEEVAPDPHALDDLHQELLTRLENELGAAVLDTQAVFGMPVVRVRRIDWRTAAEVAKGALECDFLSFVSGIDWMPAPKEGGDDAGGDTSSPVQPTETTYGAAGSEGRFQVFARVQSTHRHWGVTFKADVDEESLLVQSWVPVYAGADWHERETWEMYGFVFDGHPALRHLYLPSEFEGHPLRKDYPLLARVVKPWPGLVDVEPMPDEDTDATPATSETAEAST
jgi:NADH-quinone oxidoreductase subunit C